MDGTAHTIWRNTELTGSKLVIFSLLNDRMRHSDIENWVFKTKMEDPF
jgi:hypothetical protein